MTDEATTIFPRTMTRRDAFAGMAPQGLLANPTRDMGNEAQGQVAIDALDAADALIYELDKAKAPTE